MSAFTFEQAIDVRFRDLDPMGHVNNAVYATYLEQTRAAYFDRVVGVPLPEAPTVLASLEIDYQAEITITDAVVVRSRVTDLGTSSIPIEYEVVTRPRADGSGNLDGESAGNSDELAATATTVQVTYDTDEGDSIPIPEAWRDRIADYEGW